jgi:hypothetical protein
LSQHGIGLFRGFGLGGFAETALVHLGTDDALGR